MQAKEGSIMSGNGIGLGGNREGTNVIAYQVFSQELQNIWKEWNLRASVLISLTFQIILIFIAPVRKRSGNMIIQVVIWSSYLLADWIAAFAVGLISNSQGENQCQKAAVNKELAAFWAPFLLLHLGGPDTITAFSLEDNELWLRHLLGLVVQVVAVGYVFVQSLPNHQFWLPTALILSVGTIKYAERTRALYLACLANPKDMLRTKPNPGPKEYSANEAASGPKEIHRVQEPEEISPRVSVVSPSRALDKKDLSEEQIIRCAYEVTLGRSLTIDYETYDEGRSFIFSLQPKDAFKILEVELNFIYDALYTKMEAVHGFCFWYFLLFISSALLVAAFVIFFYRHKKGVHPFDMAITYALLAGAVVLDFVALIKLVFSDWTVALALMDQSDALLGIKFLLRNLKVPSGTLAIKRIISFRKRWCERLYQYNLISYSLKRRYAFVDKTAEFFALTEFLDRFWYRTQMKLDDSLKKFIFDILQEKAKTAIGIYPSKGACTLDDYEFQESAKLRVRKYDNYDEFVLMWHIATDICYHCCVPSHIPHENRSRSKQLSDYMFYLLIMQPKLMLSVTDTDNIRLHVNEIREYFQRSHSNNHRDACQNLIDRDTPAELRNGTSKLLLFDAIKLAKALKQMVPDLAWEMTSKVWLELLCYGAKRCRGDAHAQQLRQGGELITFVWLLMTHSHLWNEDAGMREQNS